MKISKAVGIDLGLNNCAIAMLDRTDTGIISYESRSGQKKIPSVVAYDPVRKEIIVGSKAFNRRGMIPEPIVKIKRKMGMQETVALAGKQMLPEEISACILAECKKLMSEKMNDDNNGDEYIIDRAIITVPVYYTLNAAEAVRKAGELAGFRVEEILQEPTAAAIYYYWKYGIKYGNLLVCDFGAGTFDVSVVAYFSGMPMVVGIAGNNFLGGDNLDRALARELLKRLRESDDDYSLDLDLDNENDRLRFQKLVLEAEFIKKALSDRDEVFWEKPGIFTDKNGVNVHISMDILRTDFEGIIKELVMSTIPECEKALEEANRNAGITIEDIDYILMVGGSTKIPLVRETLKNRFCSADQPHAKCVEPIIYEPDMAVVYGAAIRAAFYDTKFYNDERTICLTIETPGGFFSKDRSLCGRVDTALGVVDLTGDRIMIYDNKGTFITACEVKGDGSFKINDLPLKENSTTSFKIVLYNKHANMKIDFSVNIMPSDEVLKIDQPAVILPNSINIDYFNEDSHEFVKYQMMEKGTQLPAEGKFTFLIDENSTRKFTLNLYENYTLINTISIQFDNEVPVGTPALFELYISEKLVITAKGEVAGKTFNAVIEPPKIVIPESEYYEKLIREFDELVKYTRPGDQVRFNVQKRNICINIDEGYRDNENQRIIEYVDKFMELIAEVKRSPGKMFEPSQYVFESLVNELTVFINNAIERGISLNSTLESVMNLQNEGHKAYDSYDQEKVTEYYDALNNIRKNVLNFLGPMYS